MTNDSEMTSPTNRTTGLGRAAHFLFGNWISRIYLGTVAASALFLVWDHLASDGADPSFAGIYLLLTTSPWSTMLIVPLALQTEWTGPWLAVAGAGLGALVNTTLISLIVRAIRMSRRAAQPTG
jgi:hypothetical protein